MIARAESTIAVSPTQRTPARDPEGLSPEQHHRDFLLRALRDGASLLEILALLFTWRGLKPFDIAEKLSLPLHRVVELLASVRRHWGAANARDKRDQKLANDEQKIKRGGYEQFTCRKCKTAFRLQVLDPRLCPECLEPLRAAIGYQHIKAMRRTAKLRRSRGKGAA